MQNRHCKCEVMIHKTTRQPTYVCHHLVTETGARQESENNKIYVVSLYTQGIVHRPQCNLVVQEPLMVLCTRGNIDGSISFNQDSSQLTVLECPVTSAVTPPARPTTMHTVVIAPKTHQSTTIMHSPYCRHHHPHYSTHTLQLWAKVQTQPGTTCTANATHTMDTDASTSSMWARDARSVGVSVGSAGKRSGKMAGTTRDSRGIEVM